MYAIFSLVESQLNLASESRVKKILVIFPGALGDFICFLPALEYLARDRRVDLLARSEFADLAPPAVHTASIERRELSRLFIPSAEHDDALRDFFDSYEAIYSWMGSGDPNFVRHLGLFAAGRAKVFPFRPAGRREHISDYYLTCVAGNLARETHPAIPLKPDALLWGRRWLNDRGFGGKKILAFAPGSGAREKNWPAAFFREVLQWWELEAEQKALVILGPAEEERPASDWRAAPVARNLNLAKVAALLSLSDVYLGNDSGLSHLAARLGVETVALFGPTDPAQWSPRGRRVTVVSRKVECAPCGREFMKTCPHHDCLTTLRPEEIIDLLERVTRVTPAFFHPRHSP